MNNESAFPWNLNRTNKDIVEHEGMTLRDWFAGKIASGLFANPGGPIQANGMRGWGFCNCTQEDVAEFIWSQADAMLAEREKNHE